MKFIVYSPNSTVQQLKFGNGQAISSLTLLGIWLPIRTGIYVKTMSVKGSAGQEQTHTD